MAFFQRHGEVLSITEEQADYQTGDVVIWHLGRGRTHIGIVTHERMAGGERPLVAHHVGGYPAVDDVLFGWEIIGHFRYLGTATVQGLNDPGQ